MCMQAAGKGCELLVQVLVHETDKAGAPALTAMELEAEVSSARGRILGEALARLRNVHASKKSVASSWGAAGRSKDAQLQRSVGTYVPCVCWHYDFPLNAPSLSHSLASSISPPLSPVPPGACWRMRAYFHCKLEDGRMRGC